MWHLWKIWNKCSLNTADGKLYYEVQYWENVNGRNFVHARPANEIQSNYPDEVDAWEEKHGKAWDARFGKHGNIWNPNGQSASKRTFNDTPQKARKDDAKKTKVTVDEVDSDEEMGDATDIFSTPPAPALLNQFEIRIPSLRSSRATIADTQEDVQMSGPAPFSRAASVPGSVRTARQQSPLGVSGPSGTVASPSGTRHGILLTSPARSRSDSPRLDQQAAMIGSPPLGHPLFKRNNGVRIDQTEDSDMDELESLTSKLNFGAQRGGSPTLQVPTSTMDDELMAIYQESQLELQNQALSSDSQEETQVGSSQQVLDQIQFEKYSEKLNTAYATDIESLLRTALDLRTCHAMAGSRSERQALYANSTTSFHILSS